MATQLGNLAATASLNIDPFQQSTRVLETQMRAIDRALKAQEAGFKNNSKSISSQKAQYQLTGKSIEVYNAQLQKQQEKYQALVSATGDLSKATVQQKTDILSAEAAMATTQGKIEALTGSYNALGKQIAISESNWTKSGKALQNFGEKSTKIGEGLNSFGNKMTVGVTAPIVAGVAAVAKAAMDWESAFAGVKKTNDEVVNANGQVVYSYKDLENGLRQLSKEVPSSHKEIAEVAEAAGQLGIKTENVVSFTKTMIAMGEATNLSSDQAATSLARLANIMDMPQSQFDRLGSSIVSLGNNFATTESEITEMALRLGGVGKQLGMSESDILGIATAMSSVGLEAEAGGSAMTQALKKMQNAVAAHKDVESKLNEAKANLSDKDFKKFQKDISESESILASFAKVAGKSSDEFAKLFNDDPARALQAYVEGLDKASKNGENLNDVLGEVNIKGIREADALLRLSGNSKLLGQALDNSSQAWKENTALTNEAETRYATTESQIKMLKNELVDMGITFGGPVIQAIRDALKAIEPFIKKIAQMSQAFSEADPKTQQMILKMLGFAAAIGPVSKLLGGLFTIVGKSSTLLGGMAKAIGKVSGTARAATLATEGFSVGATVLGTSSTAGALGAGGLAASLGAIAIPAAIATAAIVATGAAVYAGAKAYESYQLAGAKWGIAVTKEQDKVITKAYELRENAVGYMNEYADGIQGSADKAIEANNKIVDSIESTIKKERERDKKATEGLYNDSAKKRAEEYIAYQEKLDKGTVASAKQATERINSIVKTASENKRTISDAEREYITANYSKLSESQLKAANFSNDQILAIQTAYQNKLSDLSTKQMQDRAQRLQDALADEQSSFEKQKDKLAKIYGQGTSEYKKELALAEEAHKQSNESMILGLAKLTTAQGFSLDQMSGAWKKYGWTIEEVQALVFNSTSKVSKNLDMMAKGISEADMQWNEMALDPKTGEIKTNMAETLQELAKTDEGWRQLKLLAKEANISSNAKEEVAIAMGMVGKWNDLYPTEQLLMVDGDKAELTMFNLIDSLGKWNEFNADRKTLGIDNADAIWKLLDSKEKIEQWESINPEDKKLLADNSDLLGKLATSQTTLENWNSLPTDEKKLLANNEDLLNKVLSSTNNLNAWNALPTPVKMMLANNDDLLSKVAGGSLSLNNYNAIPPQFKSLNGDASSVINASNDGVNALRNFNGTSTNDKYLNAVDQVSGPARNARDVLNDIRFNIPNTITKNIVTNHSDNFISSKKNATGNPYFEGGLTWLGDGGKAEPYLTPDGQFGISPADWTMYNLPRGTKIWPSVQKMMQSLPRYAEGTKFDSTAISRYSFKEGNTNNSNSVQKVMVNIEKIVWENKEDITKTMREISWMTSVNGRGSLERI